MKNTALFKLSASMVIFGTIGIFVKYIALPSGVIAFTRGLVGALFLAAVSLFGKKMDFKSIKNPFALVLSGMLIGANWVLLFEAYKYTTVSAATVCYYLAPMFVIIASPFIFGERLTFRKTMCVIAAFVGTVLVSGVVDSYIAGGAENSLKITGKGGTHIKGIVFGIGAAVLYACVIIFNKKIKDVPANEKTIVQLSSSAAVVLPYVFAAREWQKAVFDTRSILLLLVVGIVHTGVAYYLYFGAIPKLKAQTAALFSYIDPIAAILLSALFLKEKMNCASIIGVVLVISAAIINEIPENKKSDLEDSYGSDGKNS